MFLDTDKTISSKKRKGGTGEGNNIMTYVHFYTADDDDSQV